MSGHEDQDETLMEEGMPGPGAPMPLSALVGVAGLTQRDVQLLVDGGYNTVESVAYTPRRNLEAIKGISEQKASKVLAEGETSIRFSNDFDFSKEGNPLT